MMHKEELSPREAEEVILSMKNAEPQTRQRAAETINEAADTLIATKASPAIVELAQEVRELTDRSLRAADIRLQNKSRQLAA